MHLKKKEGVLNFLFSKLIRGLFVILLIIFAESMSEREEFSRFCKRVEYTIRAWYLVKFEEMMVMLWLNLCN